MLSAILSLFPTCLSELAVRPTVLYNAVSWEVRNKKTVIGASINKIVLENLYIR